MKKIISIMLSVLLIYGMIFFAAGFNEWVNKAFAIGALASVCFLVFTKSFKENVPKLIKEPIVIALFSYFAIYILSMFWAKVGKMAFDEITKLILSMCVFIITLIAVNKENMRYTLGFLSAVLGILGLLNIDLAGPKILSYPFIQIVNKIVPGIEPYGVFLSNRIWTAFGNPNIFGPVMAVGIFVSAYLYMTSDIRLERLFNAVMLTFCQIAFIACVSLGNILVLTLSLIIFILFMDKGCRLRSLFTMILSFVFSIVALVLIFGLLKQNNMLLFCDIIMLIVGILNWLILSVVRKIFYMIGENAKKVIAIVTISLIGLLIIYAIFAMNTTGPLAGESVTIRRAFYPTPGEYQICVDVDKDVEISIYTQNIEQAQSYTSDQIYKGKLNNEKIQKVNIAEDVKVAYMWITLKDATLNKIECVALDGEKINIPLKYKVVPEFIVDRLQGLKTNQSMLQRFVFWQDGIKIFTKSPIWGNGIGAFETDVNSVRNINYETKYPHNIGVKTLVEVGVVGMLIFVGLIITIYYTLLKKRCEYKQLRATLLAIVTMLIVHSFIEINMNYAMVISTFFIILAIIVVAFHEEKEEYKSINILKVRIPIIVFSVVLIGMFIANLQGQKYLILEEKGEGVFDKLNIYMTFDPFNKADYLFSYLSHATAYADIAREQKLQKEIINKYEDEAKRTLEKLNNSYAYATCEYIEKYFIQNFDIENVLNLSKVKLEKNRIDQEMWQVEFEFFETLMSQEYIKAGDLEDEYTKIVDHIVESYHNLQKINEEVLKKIKLHEKNISLVAKALKAKELLRENSTEETIKIIDNFVYDSEIMVDVNNDGINDNYKVVSNNKSIEFKVFIKNFQLAEFKGEIEIEDSSDIIKATVNNEKKDLLIEDNKNIFKFIVPNGEGSLDIRIDLKDINKLKRIIIKKEKVFDGVTMMF